MRRQGLRLRCQPRRVQSMGSFGCTALRNSEPAHHDGHTPPNKCREGARGGGRGGAHTHTRGKKQPLPPSTMGQPSDCDAPTVLAVGLQHRRLGALQHPVQVSHAHRTVVLWGANEGEGEGSARGSVKRNRRADRAHPRTPPSGTAGGEAAVSSPQANYWRQTNPPASGKTWRRVGEGAGGGGGRKQHTPSPPPAASSECSWRRPTATRT